MYDAIELHFKKKYGKQQQQCNEQNYVKHYKK